VLADAGCEFLELLAARGLHFALPGTHVDVAAVPGLRVQRRRDVVEQRELGVQPFRDLRSLVHRGQGARGGILDRNQYSPDRLHGASVAHADGSNHR